MAGLDGITPNGQQNGSPPQGDSFDNNENQAPSGDEVLLNQIRANERPLNQVMGPARGRMEDLAYRLGKGVGRNDRGVGEAATGFIQNNSSPLADVLSGDPDDPEARERAKEKAREMAKDKSRELGKKAEDKLLGKTEKVSSKVSGSGELKAGELGAKAGEEAAQVGKAGARAGQEVAQAGRAGAQAASTGVRAGAAAGEIATEAGVAAGEVAAGAAVEGGLEAAVGAAAVASGPETLGLGLVIGLFLEIAISLGISDAVDCLFEIKAGNLDEARFLGTRAAMKVFMFIVWFFTLAGLMSVTMSIFAIPALIALNVYMFIGFLFPTVGVFQGFVWWEKFGIIVADFIAGMFIVILIGGMVWFSCGKSSGGVSGAAQGVVTNWVSGTQLCNYVK